MHALTILLWVPKAGERAKILLLKSALDGRESCLTRSAADWASVFEERHPKLKTSKAHNFLRASHALNLRSSLSTCTFPNFNQTVKSERYKPPRDMQNRSSSSSQ
jgi:hypothetical protein